MNAILANYKKKLNLYLDTFPKRKFTKGVFFITLSNDTENDYTENRSGIVSGIFGIYSVQEKGEIKRFFVTHLPTGFLLAKSFVYLSAAKAFVSGLNCPSLVRYWEEIGNNPDNFTTSNRAVQNFIRELYFKLAKFKPEDIIIKMKKG